MLSDVQKQCVCVAWLVVCSNLVEPWEGHCIPRKAGGGGLLLTCCVFLNEVLTLSGFPSHPPMLTQPPPLLPMK